MVTEAQLREFRGREIRTMDFDDEDTSDAAKLMAQFTKWDALLAFLTGCSILYLVLNWGWTGIFERLASVILFISVSTFAVKPMIAKAAEKARDKLDAGH